MIWLLLTTNIYMTKFFIDTDAFIALNDESDLLHQKANKIWQKLALLKEKYSAYTSTNVLLETLTIVSQRLGKMKAIQLLGELRSGAFIVIHPSESTVFEAEKIFCRIKSKNVSYADCLSFAVMKQKKINLIFSFDKDFKKMGFSLLKS